MQRISPLHLFGSGVQRFLNDGKSLFCCFVMICMVLVIKGEF